MKPVNTKVFGRHIAHAGLAFSMLVGAAQASTTLTIATVNNGDMVRMQELSAEFTRQHPDIELNWVVLEENALRQRVTTDIATRGGQFDVMTIGVYEVPIWAKREWLLPFDNLAASYEVEDLLDPVREGLSHNGELYALPFYAESSMTFYRKDLFEAAGLQMPETPTWSQITEFAGKLHDPGNGMSGICLRGKAGWGENMAVIGTVVNSYGGRWFDMDWEPQLDSDAWYNAVDMYVNLLGNYGPSGASSNGFTENLALFNSGRCAMWVDATVAAGFVTDPAESEVADHVGFARAPHGVTRKGSNWLWIWALAVPKSTENPEEAQAFVEWATSNKYTELVAEHRGWLGAPPGTRKSLYANENYLSAAPFALDVLSAIETASPQDPTVDPVPYVGVQLVSIPEFQAIGTRVGQNLSAAIAGQASVEDALDDSQRAARRQMQMSGYYD